MTYDANIAQGLVDEVLELLHKYDESVLLPTVLGCLDIVKMQLLQDQMSDEDDEE
jgi:hypothetical protein